MISIDRLHWLKNSYALIIFDEDVIRQPLQKYPELSNKEKDQLRQTQVFKDEVIQLLGAHETFGLIRKFDGTLGWIPSKSLKKCTQCKDTYSPASKNQSAYDFISTWKGTRYVFGGISKQGIDCSGFTQLYYIDVFDKVLPKNSYDQRKLGVSIKIESVKDHDLVFCRPLTDLTSHHVAVYYKGLLWHSRRKGGVVSHTVEDFQKEFKIEEVKSLRSHLMNQKEISTLFLQTCALGNPRDAYDKYVALNFIHHNQYFKGDRESLLIAMEEARKTSPNKTFVIKQLIEEGDRVFAHSHLTKETIDLTVVHMFRFEENKIAELWDVAQVISKDSPNENGLF
jgi:predicted SnoaL-like aldol condensation-catalyzing enzyme